MNPHFSVHRWRHQNFCLRVQSQRNASQRVVRQTAGKFSQAVGRRRRNQQQVRFVGQADVRRFPAFLFGIQVVHDRSPRQRFERQRRDEPPGVRRQHRIHGATAFRQLTGQVHRFVGGDGAGNAQDNLLAHAPKPSRQAGRTPSANASAAAAFSPLPK